MTTTLKDIAAETGYSLSTVSRVLSNKISSKSKSAQQIFKSARQLGYGRYRNAKPSTRRTVDIALITQHFSEEFYAYLYAGFDKNCTENNASISIHSIRYSDSINDQLSFLSHNHDGFILFLPTLDSDGYESIKYHLPKYPIISIAPAFSPVFDTFTFDCYQGGSLAAQQLIQEGYKKFGIISGPKTKWEAALRKNGFVDTVNNANHKVTWKFDGDYSFEAGEKAFNAIKKTSNKEMGIFSSNDQMAVGFIHAALENNFSIPDDFAVIGYDNILFSKIFFPKLTTINTDIDQLSKEALDQILRLIFEDIHLGSFPRKTLIPVTIKLRNTHQNLR